MNYKLSYTTTGVQLFSQHASRVDDINLLTRLMLLIPLTLSCSESGRYFSNEIEIVGFFLSLQLRIAAPADKIDSL